MKTMNFKKSYPIMICLLAIFLVIGTASAINNPGHPWSQIDNFPAACGAGQYVSGVGSSLTCATPASGSPASWVCHDVWQPAITLAWNGAMVAKEAKCDSGTVVGGNCVYDPSNPCPAPYFGQNVGGVNGYLCGCRGTNAPPLDTWAWCCL